MVNLVSRPIWRAQPRRQTGGVTAVRIASLSEAALVRVLDFPAGSTYTVGPVSKMKLYFVYAGEGTVDDAEFGKRPLHPGDIAFVPIGESAAFSSDDGMTVVAVSGGIEEPV